MDNFKNISHLNIIKTYFRALLLLVFPICIARPLANFLGARIHQSAHVGLSWVCTPSLRLGANAHIGHLNYIRVRRLIIGKSSAIGTLNWISGHFSILLHELAEIGARNVITRAKVAKEIGSASFRLGRCSKITAGHKLDILRAISFGEHSILAGLGSQLWTHGYVHQSVGKRFRVDGAISIGNNVYIGSACIFNPGVSIVSNVAVGSHCCISKDLIKPGSYVNQPLRHMEPATIESKKNIFPVEIEGLTEPVFIKVKSYPVRKL